MKKAGFFFVLIAVLAQGISIVFGKTAALYGAGISRYLNLWYIFSILSLGCQAVVWQQALKRLPLTIAYPMMSLLFILIPILSFFIFGEAISNLQIAGTVFIAAGTILISWS